MARKNAIKVVPIFECPCLKSIFESFRTSKIDIREQKLKLVLNYACETELKVIKAIYETLK